MYVYEVQWESGISRGTGQEGKVGCKSRIYFCEQAGIMLSLGHRQMYGSNSNAGRSNHFLKLYVSKLNGTQEEKVHLLWVLRVRYTYIF